MSRGIVAAVVAFAVAVGGGAAYLVLRDRGGGPSQAVTTAPRTVTATVGQTQQPTAGGAGKPATSPPKDVSSTAESSVPEPTPGAPELTPTDEADAVVKLDDWATADESRTPPNGKWQVVLDSKYPGIKDTDQKATPFTATDIWKRFQGYRQKFPDQVDKLRVLRSSDYGDQSQYGGHTYYVVMLKFDFDERSEADSWCRSHFHKTGDALDNVCIRAHFTDPH